MHLPSLILIPSNMNFGFLAFKFIDEDSDAGLIPSETVTVTSFVPSSLPSKAHPESLPQTTNSLPLHAKLSGIGITFPRLSSAFTK